MMNEQASTRVAAPGSKDKPRSFTLTIVMRALLSTLLLSCAVGSTAYVFSNISTPKSDQVSRSDAQARLKVFNALPPLHLVSVSDGELDKALQSMHLDSVAEKTLRTDLGNISAIAQSNSMLSNPSSTSQSAALPVPAAAQTKRMQLVWITLWDTDVEDGDVVRIDSQGYSRTVRLTKKGDTFAIPVPTDGIVKVTGISDGDGGGITVGLASGTTQAIFPIMSEGQELGLKVEVQ